MKITFVVDDPKYKKDDTAFVKIRDDKNNTIIVQVVIQQRIVRVDWVSERDEVSPRCEWWYTATIPALDNMLKMYYESELIPESTFGVSVNETNSQGLPT